MKNILPVRFGIIQKTILVLAIFMMSVVWPLGAFPISHISTCEWDGMRISGPSNENEYVRQEFSPNYEQLEEISVYVANDPDSIDTMKAVLRVYDYTGNCLSENYFQLEDYMLPGYVTVHVGLKLTPGTLYFYTIGGVDGDVIVAYCGDEAKTAENGAFFYKEVPSGGTSIVTQYEYERPMGLKRIIASDLLIASVALVLLFGINIIFSKLAEDKWIKIESISKKILYGVTILGVIISFWGIVIAQLFTKDLLDNAVLFGGVIIAALLLLFGIYSSKVIEITKENSGFYIKRIVHFCRSILIAAEIIFCCMYLNGGTNYEKGLWVRCFLACFGLIIISYSKNKEIFNWFNLAWTILALIGGKYYVSQNSDHIEHINTAVHSAYVMWSMGLVVINFIFAIIKKQYKDIKIKNINIPLLISMLVFWVISVVFANGRVWPIVTLVIFTIWILKYLMLEDKKVVLEDIFLGIVFAFIGTTIFCLYRRPYQYFMLTRYGGIFFTVTVTATYLCLPISAALMMIRQYKKRTLKSQVCSCLLFGISFAYLLFTASRTGIVAVIVAILFSIFPPSDTNNIKEYLCEKVRVITTILMSIVFGFVLTYSATRMIPAIASNPFYFFYESKDATIDTETSWEGEKYDYITVRRVIGMIQERVWGVEGAFDKEWWIAEGHMDDIIWMKENGLEWAPDTSDAEKNAVETIEETAVNKYSNGRVGIYVDYLNSLNLTGHSSMQLEKEDGKILMHAHNSYIQVAYDMGIPVGSVFLIYCLVVFIVSIKQAWKERYNYGYAWLPLIIVVCFGVASLFEWIYHPYNPLGFVFLFVQTTLLIKDTRQNN